MNCKVIIARLETVSLSSNVKYLPDRLITVQRERPGSKKYTWIKQKYLLSKSWKQAQDLHVIRLLPGLLESLPTKILKCHQMWSLCLGYHTMIWWHTIKRSVIVDSWITRIFNTVRVWIMRDKLQHVLQFGGEHLRPSSIKLTWWQLYCLHTTHLDSWFNIC